MPAWRNLLSTGRAGPGAPPIDRGLSPTLWLGNGHAIFATTECAAQRLATALAATGETVAGDLLLLASLFVLGGDFWDKLRSLFSHGATVVFPGTVAKPGAQ